MVCALCRRPQGIVCRWSPGQLRVWEGEPAEGRGSDLVAGRAAWLQAFRVMPATVDLPVLVKVDQIYQELIADGAYEAGRVPADAMASA